MKSLLLIATLVMFTFYKAELNRKLREDQVKLKKGAVSAQITLKKQLDNVNQPKNKS